jgi:hypothetical protein
MFTETRLRLRGNPEVPRINSEALAFYRILFRHDDGMRDVERQIVRAIRVMIRKRMFDHSDAQGT